MTREKNKEQYPPINVLQKEEAKEWRETLISRLNKNQSEKLAPICEFEAMCLLFVRQLFQRGRPWRTRVEKLRLQFSPALLNESTKLILPARHLSH